MNFLPLVSVIIPTFNRAQLISHAIDSVLRQSYVNFELIIVNDGSSDNTEEVLMSYNDARIKIFKHSINRGQNAALNTGIKQVSGTLIAFLDSDDTWMPEMLSRQVESFRNESDPICSYTYAGKFVGDSIHIVKKFSLTGFNYREALRQCYVSHMITLMIDRRCLNIVNEFDENFTVCQDDDFCLRLAKYYPFKLIKEPLALINETENSIISNKLSYANGWKRLFLKFEQDLKFECGDMIWLYHSLRIGFLYLSAGETKRAIEWMNQLGIPISNKVTLRLFFKLFSFLYRKRQI